jgi:hypothetical protein
VCGWPSEFLKVTLSPTFTLSVSGLNLKSLMVTSVPEVAGALDAPLPLVLLALPALDAVELLDVLAFEPESLLQAAAKATMQTRPTRNVSGVRMRVWLLIRRYYGPARAVG